MSGVFYLLYLPLQAELAFLINQDFFAAFDGGMYGFIFRIN